MICLNKNYRCTETILNASYQIIREHRIGVSTPKIYSGIRGIPTLTIIETSSDKAESETIARIIQKLVGGVCFLDIDSGKVDGGSAEVDRSFSDIAVLYRTRQQGKDLEDILKKRGIPCQLVEKENIFRKKGILELLSILRLIHGCAVYPDLERALCAMVPDLNQSDIKQLLACGHKNSFSAEEIIKNVKIPISALEPTKQQMICQFADNLKKIRSEIKPFSEKLTVKMQLRHLAELKLLKTVIFKKASTTEAYNKLLDFSGQFDKDTHEFMVAVVLQTDLDTYSIQAAKDKFTER